MGVEKEKKGEVSREFSSSFPFFSIENLNRILEDVQRWEICLDEEGNFDENRWGKKMDEN